MLTTEEITKKYGEPGPDNLIMLDLPYPLRIAWDLKKTTKRAQFHKLAAPNLKAVFDEILKTYGLDEIQRLGIDLYAGTYMYRKQRGGDDWSRHAWGIAIDLDPDRNQLNWHKDKAQFAKPEYKPMIDIFYKHGFLGLGPEKNYDFMHFEMGS